MAVSPLGPPNQCSLLSPRPAEVKSSSRSEQRRAEGETGETASKTDEKKTILSWHTSHETLLQLLGLFAVVAHSALLSLAKQPV